MSWSTYHMSIAYTPHIVLSEPLIPRLSFSIASVSWILGALFIHWDIPRVPRLIILRIRGIFKIITPRSFPMSSGPRASRSSLRSPSRCVKLVRRGIVASSPSSRCLKLQLPVSSI
uniref:Uncharacterized protein n=1 Tax=Cannabis sativa TaxID=3483 RepID=A0A803QGW6_CANSA